MNDAAGILADFVYSRVNGEAGRIDMVRGLTEQVAVKVDLDQAGGGDFVEHQPVRIDEEMMFRPGHPGGDMGIDQIVPAVIGNQSVAGGKIDALAPLRLGHPDGTSFSRASAGDM